MLTKKQEQKFIEKLQDWIEVEFGYHANHPASKDFVARIVKFLFEVIEINEK
jgi:hypothetical protein